MGTPSQSARVVGGRYRIISHIASGGMGVVYRAKDELLGREVALKFLPELSATDQKSRRRLLQEARLASSLSHANICCVYDAGEHEGQVYIVLEYLPGNTLAKELKRGGLHPETVYRFGRQIADALACAHKHNIIHRDLKSCNIIITPEREAKILDFGLALRDAANAPNRASLSTQTGSMGGTLPYAAPEILQRAAPSREADIWSLGVVLYEMVTGHLPFGGSTIEEVSSAIQHDKPVPFAPSADVILVQIILRCLHKDPRARFQSAEQVRTALETGTYAVSDDAAPKDARVRPWLWQFAHSPVHMATLLLVLAATLMLGILLRTRAPVRISSIAVLPMMNLSGDPTQDYFADGMTDMLITDLGKISALRVISHTSVMTYKNRPQSIRQIAREMNLDAVIEGAVLRSGTRVQITVRLIQANTDTQLWAKTYNGEVREVMALQSDVAQAIADSIRIRLTPVERARVEVAHQLDPEAFDAYLRGRFEWERRTSEGLSEGLKDFQRAIAIQPDYALAYAGLADCYSVLGNNRFLSPDEAFPKAEAAALKALAIDDDLAEAHASLAFAHWNYDFDWEFIEKEYRRAIELNPGYANAYHWYSGFLASMGRSREAISAINKARELDPLSPRIYANAGLILYFAHRYTDAVNELEGARQLDAVNGAPDEYLGMSYLELRNYDEAISAAERSCSLGGTTASCQLDWAYALARAGQAQKARMVLRQVLSGNQSAYVPALWISRVYVGLGESDKAMGSLEQAYRERSPQLALLAVDPRFDAVKSNARFQAVLRRMRLDKVQAGNAPTPTT